MALKIKEVHPSVVGQSGNRNAFAIYDGSSLVYKTTRGGGRGAPMYGLSRTKAEFLLAKEQARRAGGGKTPKATRASTSTSRPARQKLDRQELTVASCQSFLEGQGYKVKKKKGSSRKEKSEPLAEGLLEYQALLRENPRKRVTLNADEWFTLHEQPKYMKRTRRAPHYTVYLSDDAGNDYHLEIEESPHDGSPVAAHEARTEAINAAITLARREGATLVDLVGPDGQVIELHGLGEPMDHLLNPQPMRVRSPELLSRAELLRLAKSLGVKKPHLLEKAELVYRVEKLQELEYANKVRAKRGGRPVSPPPFLVDSPKDKRRLKAKRKGLASRAPRDSQGRFKKRKNPRAMRRLR